MFELGYDEVKIGEMIVDNKYKSLQELKDEDAESEVCFDLENYNV